MRVASIFITGARGFTGPQLSKDLQNKGLTSIIDVAPYSDPAKDTYLWISETPKCRRAPSISPAWAGLGFQGSIQE